MTEKSFFLPLLSWFEENARDLPWRKTKDPYAIWVSEIMLQQTRVEAVKAYYEHFLHALPSVEDLASCPEETLLKLWEGLGYYSRVRNMQKAARDIIASENGFPQTEAELLALPGIGSYTAAAVASIACGERCAAVDGNVMRVLARYHADERDVLQAAFQREIKKRIEAEAPNACDFGKLNQAMMELGASVCHPNKKQAPHCGRCPLRRSCRALKEQRTEELPVRNVKTEKKTEERTVFIVQKGTRYAIRKRPERGLLAGLYEFPNAESFLSQKEAIRHMEAQGATVLRVKRLPESRHVFTHRVWIMKAYHLILADDSATDGWRFASAKEIREKYAIPSAFSAYVNALIETDAP